MGVRAVQSSLRPGVDVVVEALKRKRLMYEEMLARALVKQMLAIEKFAPPMHQTTGANEI
jgi:hypothetical protein